MNPPDIVYICRPGENEELRYSLRSVQANLPHSRIFIVGDAPSWVRNTELVKVPLRRDKQLTAQANLEVACRHSEISDPFIIFNDDMYILEAMNELPVLHLGELTTVIAQHAIGSAYRRAMQRTYDRMLELDIGSSPLLSYELHTPMLIRKDPMLEALELGAGIHGMHNRTMYGNLVRLGGTLSNDFKVYNNDRNIDFDALPFLSTSDRTFLYHPAGRYIRKTFTESSIYEAKARARKYEAKRYSTVTFAR